VSRGRVLDLFAGVGGAARGFERLGFDVIGVDRDPSRKYPAECIEADLRDGLPEEVESGSYRFAWASPPCQGFSTMPGDAPNLVPLARSLLDDVDADATVIENVPGAREVLDDPIVLSGATEREPFRDLDVRKRRLFEVSWRLYTTSPPRDPDASFGYAIGSREEPAQGFREAHGLGSTSINTKELHEAIPPAYVRYLVNSYRSREGLDPIEEVIEA
jgi:SAM-dependent methyltransferase